MAIRLRIPGLGDVECDSATDLLELKKAFDADKQASAQQKPAAIKPMVSAPVVSVKTTALPTTDTARSTLQRVSAADRREAIAYLGVISKLSPDAALAEHLLPVLNVRHAKGIGTALIRIKNVLTEAGFDHDRVFQHQRTRNGREYRAGPDAGAALAALQRQK